MTEQTQPTDAEIDTLISKHWPAFSTAGAFPLKALRNAFREGIFEWGTPAGAGEVVAWLSTDSIGERYLCFTKPKDSDPARPLVFGDATPQPTQAQAGAVPLTQYRVLEPRVDRIEAGDEFLQDDAQTWAIDPNGTFVGTIYGYALRAARRRIKGADHGL